ncbi:hypothetical protein GYMLUDRAFT_982767 [Collybiopsis luxurians FD-317 M1]|uniref:Uncharacterized protein n=1 Tax=Collybiopsis luxurians FD-317 M1 TaxID=944289 RepID=A0A0D0ALJ5_9AGAR|nr:hypothetical protein GYMLUDRAFT_982767 [Collybiopsis luxurians FD-317 M1]
MEHVPRPWPTANQIEQLVRMASGHFVFASMVVKFIDDDYAVPADRVESVLNITGPEDHPKSRSGELDYQTMSTVLTKTSSFAHILQDALSEIHSLLNNPSPVDSGLRFCHASIADILRPKSRGDLMAAPRYLRTTLNIRERAGKGKVQGLSNKKSHFMDRLCEALSIKKRGVEFKLPVRTPLACNEKVIGAGKSAPIQILEINTQGGLEGVRQRQASSNVEAREERVTIKEQALNAREASVVAREANIAAREASFATREADIAARERNISVRARNVASREKSCAAKERSLLYRVQSGDPGAVCETGDVLLHGDLTPGQKYHRGKEAEKVKEKLFFNKIFE